MRLGSYVFSEAGDVEGYVREHTKKGLRAAYCPDWLNSDTNAADCAQFKALLAKNDIVLAEVGAWKNVLSPNPADAKQAFDHVVRRLQTADELGACCAVDILGSYSTRSWDGPCYDDYGEDFFDQAVEVWRKVLDLVKPAHTKMTFEIMPQSFLDSAEEYMRFLKALDRSAAGIHMDITNCITNPRLLREHKNYFTDAFKLFGPNVLSIHIKDMDFNPAQYTVCLDEVLMGRGKVDIVHVLQVIDATQSRDTPVMLEHLETEADYDAAMSALRSFAKTAKVNF
jgi:sugar phosphate isomerase/epimerase